MIRMIMYLKRRRWSDFRVLWLGWSWWRSWLPYCLNMLLAPLRYIQLVIFLDTSLLAATQLNNPKWAIETSLVLANGVYFTHFSCLCLNRSTYWMRKKKNNLNWFMLIFFFRINCKLIHVELLLIEVCLNPGCIDVMGYISELHQHYITANRRKCSRACRCHHIRF